MVSTLQLLLKAEQLLELTGPLRSRALLLKLHLQLAELPLELLVLRAHAAEIHVSAPRVANAAGEAGRAALHFGERAEGDDLEQRHAGAASSPAPK